MDRLIKDAAKIDKTFKYNTKTVVKNKKAVQELDYTYADIVRAIHIVQTEMGITGTTAKEAEHTISGSLNMVKAAWKNLLTGIGEGDDRKIDMLVQQLVYSAEKYIDNLLPVVENILYGLVTLIEDLAPVIAERLPGFIERILPGLTKAAATLITAFAKAIIENIPAMLEAAKEIVVAVYEAIEEAAPGLMPALFGIGGIKVASTITNIVNSLGGLITKLGGVQTAAQGAQTAMAGMGTSASGLIGVLGGLATAALAVGDAIIIAYDVQKLNEAYRGYKEAGDAHMNERETAIENYRKLVKEKGLAIANEWAQACYGIESTSHGTYQTERMILKKIEDEWAGVPQNIWDGLKQGWDHYFGKDGSGIDGLLEDGVVGPIYRKIKEAWDWGKDLIHNFADGISNTWKAAKQSVVNVAKSVASFLGFSEPEEGPLSNFHTYAPDMMALFAQGIEDNKHLITDAIGNSFNIAPMVSGNPGTAVREVAVPRDGGVRDIIIPIIIDGREFARAEVPYIEAEQNRVGLRLTTGGAY